MAVRTMERNSLNLGTDAASAALVMQGIAIDAARREHLADAIVTLAFVGGEILVETADAGQAVHLANSLGLPTDPGPRRAFGLPRKGTIEGFVVLIQTAAPKVDQ